MQVNSIGSVSRTSFGTSYSPAMSDLLNKSEKAVGSQSKEELKIWKGLRSKLDTIVPDTYKLYTVSFADGTKDIKLRRPDRFNAMPLKYPSDKGPCESDLEKGELLDIKKLKKLLTFLEKEKDYEKQPGKIKVFF